MKLIIKGITKSYGSTLALSNFTATLEPGIYALLGPNGSGKSTLMNIITDNLKADSGEILYDGGSGNAENVLKMGVRFREKIGFMPQYPGLYPNFTDPEKGNVILRILSDDKPTNQAYNVTPTLEDYYLYVFEDIIVAT